MTRRGVVTYSLFTVPAWPESIDPFGVITVYVEHNEFAGVRALAGHVTAHTFYAELCVDRSEIAKQHNFPVVSKVHQLNAVQRTQRQTSPAVCRRHQFVSCTR